MWPNPQSQSSVMNNGWKNLNIGNKENNKKRARKGRQSNLKEFPSKQIFKETVENKLVSASEHVDELRKQYNGNV